MNLDPASSCPRTVGFRRPLVVASLLLVSHLLLSPGRADSAPASGKARYHLFRPTPAEQMRELSTDRPDQTESPYTVDAGHFQVEMDLVNAVLDHDLSSGGDLRTTGWGTSLNLKAGLSNNVDIQFVLDPFVSSRLEDRAAHATDRASGFGDIQTRVKINLWGNDGGATALCLMPFVKWPLASSRLRNGRTEGGVIVPLAVGLPRGWASTVMTELDLVSNGGSGYDTEFVNSITFSHDIAGRLSGYVEYFSVVSRAPNTEWQGQADVGFTASMSDNAALDFGCNFGATGSAPDFSPFVGVSLRY